MKKFFGKETIIGLCVLIALLILFFGINYLKGVNILKPSNHYYAVYENVNGLNASAPVTVNGVKVGNVDEVYIPEDNTSRVIVQFSIDKDKNLAIPVGSKAVIVTSMLGEASIKLEFAQNSAKYAPGDTIPAMLEQGMIDRAGDVASNLSGKVDKLMTDVDNILPKVDSLFVNLNQLTSNQALYQTLANIQAFTANLQTTLSIINKSAENLNPIMADLKSITTNIDSISANMTAVTNSLNNGSIEKTLANVELLSDNLRQITEQINNPESNLGQLLHGTELYDNLVKTTADIDALLIDIKQNPKRYISIKLL